MEHGDDVINCLHLRKEIAGGSMSSSNNTDYDFETWAALAKADPQAFEAQRRVVIAEALAAKPPHQQARMRGLQWRNDMERTRYRHPLVSCTRVFNQMWSTVYGEGGLVDALNGRVSPASESAAILPFAPVKPQSTEGVAMHSYVRGLPVRRCGLGEHTWHDRVRLPALQPLPRPIPDKALPKDLRRRIENGLAVGWRDAPVAALDLFFQLAGRPSHVAYVHAQGLVRIHVRRKLTQGLDAAAEIDIGEDVVHRSRGVAAHQNEHLIGGDGPADVEVILVEIAEFFAAREGVGDGDVGRMIDDEPGAAVAGVAGDQDEALAKTRVDDMRHPPPAASPWRAVSAPSSPPTQGRDCRCPVRAGSTPATTGAHAEGCDVAAWSHPH